MFTPVLLAWDFLKFLVFKKREFVTILCDSNYCTVISSVVPLAQLSTNRYQNIDSLRTLYQLKW